MKLYTVLFMLVFTVACSTTVTGPITKNKYNLDVGCTDDMQDYKRTRKELVADDIKKNQLEKMKLDCAVLE